MYKLFIVKSGMNMRTLFEVPLNGMHNEEEAIEYAKRLKSILKDGYAVEIMKSELKSCGFVVNCK